MTAFSHTVARAWERNHLMSALVELTYRCNWDCVFCYNDLGLRGRLLSTERHLALLAELRDLQCLTVVLSGGEPLAHPDFFAIGRRARELELAVRLKSNGYAMRGATARRVRDELAPMLVEVSLHGATAEVHDRQTRVPGSFARLIDNLREMRALGLRLKLNAPLTAWNEHELEHMFALADELGLPLQVDPEVSPRDDGDKAPLALAPTPAGIRRLFELLRARAGTTPAPARPAAAPPATTKHCGAGSSTLAIDPAGNVYPCVQWRQPLGNLHERSLADIWRGTAAGDVRRTTTEIKQWLAAEHDGGQGLAFCPGASHTHSGAADRLYPAAETRRRISLPVVP